MGRMEHENVGHRVNHAGGECNLQWVAHCVLLYSTFALYSSGTRASEWGYDYGSMDFVLWPDSLGVACFVEEDIH